ncbi:MAG: M15 family metallopeptidase, partial [Bacteroidota bacterium]
MPRINGPITGKSHNVKFGGFQNDFLFEFTNKKELISDYGSWEDVWGSDTFLPDIQHDRNGRNTLLFGDFGEKDWAKNNITKAYFKGKTISGAYPVESNWGTDGVKDKNDPNYHWYSDNFIKCNVCLVITFEKLLRELFAIANRLDYKIRTFHTYCFRYKKGTGRLIANDVQNDTIIWEKLSNHSLGSAIDINAKQNWWGETIWDIPPEIVKLFRRYGFYWGGEYRSTKDAMHFEYKLPYIDIPKFYFPLATKDKPETPLVNLKRNEAGKGGFFPVGLQQNLHAGVHLPVASEGAEVRCLTSGYIVAARLMAPGQAGDNQTLQKFIGKQHLGFALVRHEITDTEKNENFPLYSLYMHLSPPQWEKTDDPYAVNVPWFKKIVKMSYGGVVDLDPSSSTMGQNHWAVEAIKDAAKEFKVVGDKTLKAENEGRVTAFAKAAPEDIHEAIIAFKKGYMVSFNSPVLPVKEGELIGYAKPLSGASTAFIHWELFSPADDSGLEKLKSIDTDIASLFERISEEREDNFFEMPKPDGSGENELEPLLIDKLPDDDQQYLQDIISKSFYKKKLKEFFNTAQSFSKESLDDAGTAETFTYPVSLTLENPYGYEGTSKNQSTIVTVSFKKNGAAVGKKGSLTISDYSAMEFNIQVPADADTICLESDNCTFESIPLARLDPKPTESSCLEPILSCRWRNIILTHLTEWKPEGLNLLLDKLDEKGYLFTILDDLETQKSKLVEDGLIEESDDGVDILKKLLLPLAWWGRQTDSSLEIYGGEHAVCGGDGSEKSIF